MTLHSFDLIDQTVDLNLDIEVSPASLGLSFGNWHVEKRQLRGGLSQGVDVVEVNNGRMRFVLLPTRGMGIWRAWQGDRTLGWQSPVRGPVHPAFVALSDASGFGWLDGFDELMCRCGLQSNGAPDFDAKGVLTHPLHGHIANRPVQELRLVVDDAKGVITLLAIVEETRFHFQKLQLLCRVSTAFDSPSLSWQDTVKNIGGSQTQMQMLYHTNVGMPELRADSIFHAPVNQVAPMGTETPVPTASNWQEYAAPSSEFSQQVYLFDLLSDQAGQTQVLLENANRVSAVGLRYRKPELPCFSLWKNLVAEADGYVTGLEPATNFPYPHSAEVEAGRVVQLEPGEEWHAHVELDWWTTEDEVTSARRAILQMQGEKEPRFCANLSEWEK